MVGCRSAIRQPVPMALASVAPRAGVIAFFVGRRANNCLDSRFNSFSFCSMNTLRTKDEVDPSRFAGKNFTRRKAFPDSQNDYSILIDGLKAGRIMKMIRANQREVWFRTLTGPYFPGPKSHDGEEDTFEAARDEFKKVFWRWHAWALQQPGKATWYGAEE
jgi:hypothetical protein